MTAIYRPYMQARECHSMYEQKDWLYSTIS